MTDLFDNYDDLMMIYLKYILGKIKKILILFTKMLLFQLKNLF